MHLSLVLRWYAMAMCKARLQSRTRLLNGILAIFPHFFCGQMRHLWHSKMAMPLRLARGHLRLLGPTGNAPNPPAWLHSRLENFTRAQLWLRRAAQYAPDDATKAVVAKDFRTVRERNPWSSSLRFGIFPRSNINNGSTAKIYYLPGLDFPLTLQPSSRALSRFEISGGFSSQYRLHLDDVSATFLTATINPSDLISDPRSKQL